MVLTHKKMSESRKPIVYKPDNPNRIHMSKAEVLEENALKKAKAAKMKEAEAKIDAELGLKEASASALAPAVPQIETQGEQSSGERIAELTSLMNGLKGPGSKAKREAIQDEINKLQG